MQIVSNVFRVDCWKGHISLVMQAGVVLYERDLPRLILGWVTQDGAASHLERESCDP